jgi:hypothetical protein
MGVGTIMYYLLWPVIILILLIFWLFKYTTLVMEVGVEFARGLHDDVKDF